MGGDGETPPPAAGGDPFVVPEEQRDATLDAAVSGADIKPETEGDVAVAMGESVQGGDTPVQRDRRPHRRRGRRGGRRGRENRGPDDDGSTNDGSAGPGDGSSTPPGN